MKSMISLCSCATGCLTQCDRMIISFLCPSRAVNDAGISADDAKEAAQLEQRRVSSKILQHE